MDFNPLKKKKKILQQNLRLFEEYLCYQNWRSNQPVNQGQKGTIKNRCREILGAEAVDFWVLFMGTIQTDLSRTGLSWSCLMIWFLCHFLSLNCEVFFFFFLINSSIMVLLLHILSDHFSPLPSNITYAYYRLQTCIYSQEQFFTFQKIIIGIGIIDYYSEKNSISIHTYIYTYM